MNRCAIVEKDHVISFRIPATGECGVFASAGKEFSPDCICVDVVVNHESRGPQLSSYHEYRCQSRSVVIATAILRQSGGAGCPKSSRAPIRVSTRSRR